MLRRAGSTLWRAATTASASLHRESARSLSRNIYALSTSHPATGEGDNAVQEGKIDTYTGQEPPSILSGTSSKDMLAVFTCTKCDTRSAKPFSKRAYEHGIVIVTCPGCKSRHLLADRLGWFGEKGSIEDVLAERGEQGVVRSSRADGTMEVTLEEILGQSSSQ